jgi:hypothetical protein
MTAESYCFIVLLYLQSDENQPSKRYSHHHPSNSNIRSGAEFTS